jgi:non-ribosomal peptide synthetase component E (peptide arylation enzyme)
MRHLAGRLARYKLPGRLWFVDALPSTATGKVVKRRIIVPDGTSDDVGRRVGARRGNGA